MKANRKFVINDAEYAYSIHGEGVPVLLLHGFTGSSATWSEFTLQWQSQFQIITVDLPGHGKSKAHSPRSMKAFCDDLQGLLSHLNLAAVHLVGYSMGGRTALSFAMLHPKMVLTLTLESASPGLASLEARNERVASDERLAQRLENDGINKFVQFWENISLFQSQKNLPAHVQQVIRSERLSQTAPGLAESLRYMGTGAQPSCWHRLGQLHQPVLLLAGEHDEKFIMINEKMNQSLPNADLIIIPNAGHAIHVEKPAKFGKLVTEFILQYT